MHKFFHCDCFEHSKRLVVVYSKIRRTLIKQKIYKIVSPKLQLPLWSRTGPWPWGFASASQQPFSEGLRHAPYRGVLAISQKGGLDSELGLIRKLPSAGHAGQSRQAGFFDSHLCTWLWSWTPFRSGWMPSGSHCHMIDSRAVCKAEVMLVKPSSFLQCWCVKTDRLRQTLPFAEAGVQNPHWTCCHHGSRHNCHSVRSQEEASPTKGQRLRIWAGAWEPGLPSSLPTWWHAAPPLPTPQVQLPHNYSHRNSSLICLSVSHQSITNLSNYPGLRRALCWLH